MAGRGSRFANRGIPEPKPLIDLGGRPFFWWAVESVRRQIVLDRIVFVILEEHVADWKLDAKIRAFYPNAEILAIPDVTAGSAETAALGVDKLNGTDPIIINDCDHAFVASRLGAVVQDMRTGFSGALTTFPSDSPNFSFVVLDDHGTVTGTIEKQVASPFAIAGCYMFSSPSLYREQYRRYQTTCPYNELYISGIYNQMIGNGMTVGQLVLDRHFAFGTPDEFEAVESILIDHLSGWLAAR
jgi:dTDP-glucose pyrophosphorylase